MTIGDGHRDWLQKRPVSHRSRGPCRWCSASHRVEHRGWFRIRRGSLHRFFMVPAHDHNTRAELCRYPAATRRSRRSSRWRLGIATKWVPTAHWDRRWPPGVVRCWSAPWRPVWSP